MSGQKTVSKRILLGGLAVLMAIAFMPAGVFAAGSNSSGITVYLTVSDKGNIAQAKDGSAMAWKEVTVRDIDGDGTYSYDEALTAAHAAYNTADGYTLGGKDYVKKLWGEESGSFLFFDNGKGLSNGVSTDKVNEGDSLVAAVLSDTQTYGDWYSEFDKKA